MIITPRGLKTVLLASCLALGLFFPAVPVLAADQASEIDVQSEQKEDTEKGKPAAVEASSKEEKNDKKGLLASGVAVAGSEGEDATEAEEAKESAIPDEGPSEQELALRAQQEAERKAEEAELAKGSDYSFQLRGIEERVNELKERIFQAKARLSQLQEAVLSGNVSGAQATVIHRNEMGSSFRLVKVQYALDGAVVFTRADGGDGDLSEEEEIEIFSGGIAPGEHQISVYTEYRGHGYGVFSYLKGYTFKVRSSYVFEAEKGKRTLIHVVGYEQGNVTTELKERPAVKYEIGVEDLSEEEQLKKDSGKPASSESADSEESSEKESEESP